MIDLLQHLARPGQPQTLYRELELQLSKDIGFGLFTLLYADGHEVARVYSSDEKSYPVFGRKAMGPTPWGEKVLKNGNPSSVPTRLRSSGLSSITS